MSLYLEDLLDVGWRHYVVGLVLRKIMSIGAVLGHSHIIVILDPVGVLVAYHLWSYGLEILLLDEG
jgi:hypothetical protein